MVHTPAVCSLRYEALGKLGENEEARVAWGVASSNSYASFVLSKLPACFISQWMLADVWTNCQLLLFLDDVCPLCEFVMYSWVIFILMLKSGTNSSLFSLFIACLKGVSTMLICILEIFVCGIQSLNSGVSHTGFDQSALFWRICKGLYEGYLK